MWRSRKRIDVEERTRAIGDLILQGDHAQAVSVATELIEVLIKYPKLHVELFAIRSLRGYALNEMDRFEEAIPDFDAALASNPSDGFSYSERGVAKKRLGRIDEALVDLIAGTRLSNRRQPDEFHELGDLYLQIGEFVKALETYQTADEVEGTLLGTTCQIEALIELSRLDQAVNKCSEALLSDDPYGSSYRGWICMLKTDYQIAQEHFIQATNGMDDGCGAYAFYGAAWLATTCPLDSIRNIDLAESALSTASESDLLARWEIHRLRAAFCANQNEWDDAAKQQNFATEQCPEWAKNTMLEVADQFQKQEPIRSIDRGVRVFPRV